MRLICPNCGAQYEVDDRVIPDAGRDVQCSSCGHGWFQVHPEQDEELAEELGLEPVTPTPQLSDLDAPQPDDSILDLPRGEDAPARRELDEGVRSILQEEAQLEIEARTHERENLETQTDLGLDDSDDEGERRSAIRNRMARMRGMDEGLETAEDDDSARRDLLPDIEEINSSLDSGSEAPAPADPGEVAQTRRSGFRSGFILMMVFAAVSVSLYVYAPLIVESLPASKPYMIAYVEGVDQLRAWLDSIVQTAITKMQAMSG